MIPDELKNKKIILVKEDPFFFSPQGEGKFMGRLSSWMRSSTCNLRCAWDNGDGTVTLCDTAYSSHIPSRNVVTMEEAFNKLVSENCEHVVLTGGEPTSQKNLIQLIDYLEDSGKRVTVETNGTNFFESKATLVSMSPKLKSSSSGLKLLSEKGDTHDTDEFLFDGKYGPDRTEEEVNKVQKQYKVNLHLHEKNRYNLESMGKIMEFYGPDRYQFKFVVNSKGDVEEILEKYVKPLNIPKENVWLMPQGITHEQLQDRSWWVVKQCKEHGFNYSDRIHVRIYGNQIGV